MTSLAAAGLADPALAHPHVFIDTTVTAILDGQGRLTAVRLRWDYDSLVSMVVVEDKAADADMDGRISPAEAVALDGFDMTWIDGFDGDTSLFQGETRLPLEEGPQDWVTGWTEAESGGHLWSEHTRKLVSPVDPGDGPVSVLVYDVTDYTAYALVGAELKPVDALDGALSDCRIAPATVGATAASGSGSEEGGLLATLSLFVFGQNDGAAVGSVVPGPAAGRVTLVLACG
ncbi:MAG: DUF1007 family protein [Tabrizicola sp.]|nr:DUF1007 family protein [Tabrizicola sp.]